MSSEHKIRTWTKAKEMEQKKKNSYILKNQQLVEMTEKDMS